jgi:hypothetical protein
MMPGGCDNPGHLGPPGVSRCPPGHSACHEAFRLMDVVLVCAGEYLSRIHQAECRSGIAENGHEDVAGGNSHRGRNA